MEDAKSNSFDNKIKLFRRNQRRKKVKQSCDVYSLHQIPAIKWNKNPQTFKCFRTLSFMVYLLLLICLYQTEKCSKSLLKQYQMLSVVYTLMLPVGLCSGMIFVSASNSFAGDFGNDRGSNYGIQNINSNIKSHSMDSLPSSYDLQAGITFRGQKDKTKRQKYSSSNTDNKNQSYNKNYLASFSSSSYDPKRAPNILQRTFSEMQLKQLFRSSGCVNDEIKLVGSSSYLKIPTFLFTKIFYSMYTHFHIFTLFCCFTSKDMLKIYESRHHFSH